MWEKIIAPNVQGEMSPAMLGEFCVYYANSLEATRMTDDEDLDLSWFGMPISPKNCMPQQFNYYLLVGDSIAW